MRAQTSKETPSWRRTLGDIQALKSVCCILVVVVVVVVVLVLVLILVFVLILVLVLIVARLANRIWIIVLLA